MADHKRWWVIHKRWWVIPDILQFTTPWLTLAMASQYPKQETSNSFPPTSFCPITTQWAGFHSYKSVGFFPPPPPPQNVCTIGSREMVQWFKSLATLLVDLALIPSIHIVDLNYLYSSTRGSTTHLWLAWALRAHSAQTFRQSIHTHKINKY